MANIRFVKPPNDNRIRSLPAVGIAPTPVPKENFFITSSAPKISNLIHITTSKQKNNADTAEMFIKSKNNNYQQGMSSSLAQEQTVCNSNNKYDNSADQTNINFDSTRRGSFQKLSSNNVFTSNQNDQQKVENSNVSSELFRDNPENLDSPSSEKNNNNCDKAITNKKESCNNNNNNNNDSITETVEGTHDIHDEYMMNNYPSFAENQKDDSETKSQLTSFDFDQTDDQEEEDDTFPELHSLVSSIESNVCQENQPMLTQQNDQPKRPSKDVQEKQLIPPSVSPSLAAASQDRHRQQLSYIFQTGARSKYARSYRPIHRSISDAALIENNRLTSFFKSITDDRYYGLDEEDYDDDDDDADFNLIETGDSKRKNDLRRLKQPLKVAWDTSIKNQTGTIFDKTMEKTNQKEPGKTPAPKSSEGHVMFSRSLSGDSMIADRLRIRRCALADPENMIMRQEVREKIEREVERRRSSMVRKISQFFNVHLGLNKEEDLI